MLFLTIFGQINADLVSNETLLSKILKKSLHACIFMFKLFLSIKLYYLLLFISVAVTVKNTMTPALPTRLLETLWMRWSKGTYKGTHQVSVSIFNLFPDNRFFFLPIMDL